MLNEIGEKVSRRLRMQDEASPHIAAAGKDLVAINAGFTTYKNLLTEEEFFLAYAPVQIGGYGLALAVPRDEVALYLLRQRLLLLGFSHSSLPLLSLLVLVGV